MLIIKDASIESISSSTKRSWKRRPNEGSKDLKESEIRLLPKQTNHPQPPSIPFLFSRFIVFRFIFFFFLFSSCRVRRSSSDELNESGGQMSSGTAPLIIPYLDRLCRRLFHFTRSSLNVIRSTRISTHTGVTLLRLDRLALASHLLRAHTHARASTIISSSWSRRPSSSHGKILVASFSPATFCKKKKEFCNMKYSSHWNCANCLSLCFKKKKEKRKKSRASCF